MFYTQKTLMPSVYSNHLITWEQSIWYYPIPEILITTVMINPDTLCLSHIFHEISYRWKIDT